MKKLIAVLIMVLFLIPPVALAGRPYHGDKYKPKGHKKPRAHKEDRYAPVHPRFKRGHVYSHSKRRPEYKTYYRRHYTWNEWYGGARDKHPHGRYQRDRGQMMFSYCEGGICFSFSIGD